MKKEAEKQEKEKQRILAREASQSKPAAANKWREKDVKMLYDRGRDRYLQLAKLRFNVVKVDPSIKMKKKLEKIQKQKSMEQRQAEKKRKQKADEKRQEYARALALSALLKEGRGGLRSRGSKEDNAPADEGLF